MLQPCDRRFSSGKLRILYVDYRTEVCREETLTPCGGHMLAYAILYLACAAIFLEMVYRAPMAREF